MTITIKFLDKMYTLTQIAEAELRLLEIESSCTAMCNGTYNDRKRAIIEEYKYQKRKLQQEFEQEQEAIEKRGSSLKDKMNSFLDNADVTVNQSADQIFNVDHVDSIDDLDEMDKRLKGEEV